MFWNRPYDFDYGGFRGRIEGVQGDYGLLARNPWGVAFAEREVTKSELLNLAKRRVDDFHEECRAYTWENWVLWNRALAAFVHEPIGSLDAFADYVAARCEHPEVGQALDSFLESSDEKYLKRLKELLR